jgi:hypothetical protein
MKRPWEESICNEVDLVNSPAFTRITQTGNTYVALVIPLR